MTTATITRKTRNLGYGFSLFGEEVTAPDFEGTPKQVVEYVQKIRLQHTTGKLDSFRSAWFLDGKRIEIVGTIGEDTLGLGHEISNLVDSEDPTNVVTVSI